MADLTIDDPPVPADLEATEFIDSDSAAVRDFVASTTAGCTDDRERAVALFEAVRDGIRYDPYDVSRDPADYRASAVLAGTQRWCVPKSVLLTAACRAAGIPSRLGFSDVKNHLQSEKLGENMGTDLFAWHGYSLIHLDGQWRKASAAFNRSLCERFGTRVLEFDGRSDALLHAFDDAGNRHMEYVADRGIHQDLPLDDIFATFDVVYPDLGEGGSHTRDDMFHD